MLFAIGSLESGGSETQLTELLVRAHRRYVNATLVLMEHPHDERRLDRVKAAGVPTTVIGVNGSRWQDPIRLSLGYWRAISRARPDVVYSWLEETSMFLVPLTKVRRLPVVVARRNVSGSPNERRRYVASVIRRAEAAAGLVTGNSQAVLDAAEARGIARERLRLVPNGHPRMDPLAYPNHEEFTFGYLARFRPEKGHMRLLDVAVRLPRDLPWRLVLGGDGPLESAVRARARELNIHDRVEFVGDVMNVREFWSGIDAAVLLSDHEGSSNSLIEAAFAGRPLVATATGGSVELVTPEMGFLVGLDDVTGTLDALVSLMRDPARGRLMGTAAYTAVATKHNMDRSIAGHAAVLAEALKTGRR